MSDTPKPCPFCGAPVKEYLATNEETWVMCSNAACQFQPAAAAPGLTVGESGWNKRPTEDALEARLVALERIVQDQAGNIRHLQRTAKILDKAHKKWREDSRENDFWAYVMQSVGQVDAEESAE